jgi:hypothetical protein
MANCSPYTDIGPHVRRTCLPLPWLTTMCPVTTTPTCLSGGFGPAGR